MDVCDERSGHKDEPNFPEWKGEICWLPSHNFRPLTPTHPPIFSRPHAYTLTHTPACAQKQNKTDHTVT